MNYEEAIQKSLTVKWKVDTCSQGEQCWCRVIKCEEPLMFKEKEYLDEDEYYIVGTGDLNKETAEHIVKIHNQTIN
jgi:hypothetical protein